jgi:hypothetical protein
VKDKGMEIWKVARASVENGDPVDGIVEIAIYEYEIRRMIARAAKNKSRESHLGAVRVRFKPCSKEQADFLLNPQRAATPSTDQVLPRRSRRSARIQIPSGWSSGPIPAPGPRETTERS